MNASIHEEIQSQQLSSFWQWYRSFVRRNSVAIDLIDCALSQLLFLTPQERQNRWREVVHGLMSLNRMAIDMAQHDDHLRNSFGTSITLQPTSTVPATSMRVFLNVTHSLLPSLLELTNHSPDTRLLLERSKFLVRFLLLSTYWYQLWREDKTDAAGLILQGGMYHPHEDQGTSVEDHRSQCMRRDYVGKRTGRRVVRRNQAQQQQQQQQQRSLSDEQKTQNGSFMTLMLGEFLYIYRPLYWARMEQRYYRPSLKQWVLSVGMDLASLVLLRQHRKNRVSREEVRRRKIKLFFYLLRSPIWERYTQQGVERVSRGFQRVPLLGRVFNTYLWDWLLYCKHPFISEEG